MAQAADLRRAFELDWESCLRLEVNEQLCRHAGDLAEAHGLRGFDSLHLASYLQLRSVARDTPVEFSAFDQALTAAAASHDESR